MFTHFRLLPKHKWSHLKALSGNILLIDLFLQYQGILFGYLTRGVITSAFLWVFFQANNVFMVKENTNLCKFQPHQIFFYNSTSIFLLRNQVVLTASMSVISFNTMILGHFGVDSVCGDLCLFTISYHICKILYLEQHFPFSEVSK